MKLKTKSSLEINQGIKTTGFAYDKLINTNFLISSYNINKR